MINRKGILSRNGRTAISAFSLVEVVMAMGIITFALVALMGLLMGGIRVNRDSTEESRAVNLLQAIITDRQAGAPLFYATNSPVYGILPLTNSSSPYSNSAPLYIMDDGVTTNDTATAARYAVNYTVYPPAASPPLQPYLVNFKVSWPAAQTNGASSVETTATFKQQ